ncbi:unnamed protein product [Calypogeia fissa]
MTSMAIHCCCSPLIAHPTRAIFSSSSSGTSNGMVSPTPRMRRRSSSSALASSSASASAAPRVQLQQQAEFEDEHGHLRRSTIGMKKSEVNSEPSSPSASVSYASSSSSPTGSCVCHRRDFFHLGAAAVVVGAQLMVVGRDEATAAFAAEVEVEETAMPTNPPANPKPANPPANPPAKSFMNDDKADTTITDKVYLDLSVCPSASRSDRTLGNTSQLCNVGEPLGRIVIGLYGRLVPQTVKNFKAMITGAAGTSYAGTIIHRVLPGQYIQGGRQGSKDKGEVSGPLYKLVESNKETVVGKSYKLTHSRPGTVSLALAENDDEEDMKLDLDYRNVQFLITTGPGPAHQLDNRNIIFGTVLEGLDVVAGVANIPTYRPSERIKQFNDFASFIGDERAANARNFWDRPLKSVVITGCGEIPLGMPVFPPGLP